MGQYWKDIIPFNFLDGSGLLTPEAKDFMRKNDLKTLDEALAFVELEGLGYFYDNDLDRPDVHYSGHIAHVVNNL